MVQIKEHLASERAALPNKHAGYKRKAGRKNGEIERKRALHRCSSSSK